MKNVLFLSQAHADSAATPPAPGGVSSTTEVPSTAPMGGAPQASPFGMLLPFGLMFVVIYFFMIRPQQRKMKDHQALIEKVKHGDEIVTTSGFFGKVIGITDKVLTVELADGVRVKMLKSQIASVNPEKAAEVKI